MKRIILVSVALTFVLISCNRIDSQQEGIQVVQEMDSSGLSTPVEYQFGDTIEVFHSYTCKAVEPLPNFDFASVQILNKDTLEVINKSSGGYGGYKIRFLVDRNLKVQKLEYEDWGDVIGYVSINTVLKIYYFELNKNPFKEGIDGLSGEYRFLHRNDGYADSSLYEVGEKPHTFYYDNTGEFTCNI